MATPTQARGFNGRDDMFVITWVLTTADGVGDFVQIPRYFDKTVHVFGTFGGGTVDFIGSNEPDPPTNGIVMEDMDANPATVTAAALLVLKEVPRVFRPQLVGSAGATVTVIVVGRR